MPTKTLQRRARRLRQRIDAHVRKVARAKHRHPRVKRLWKQFKRYMNSRHKAAKARSQKVVKKVATKTKQATKKEQTQIKKEAKQEIHDHFDTAEKEIEVEKQKKVSLMDQIKQGVI